MGPLSLALSPFPYTPLAGQEFQPSLGREGPGNRGAEHQSGQPVGACGAHVPAPAAAGKHALRNTEESYGASFPLCHLPPACLSNKKTARWRALGWGWGGIGLAGHCKGWAVRDLFCPLSVPYRRMCLCSVCSGLKTRHVSGWTRGWDRGCSEGVYARQGSGGDPGSWPGVEAARGGVMLAGGWPSIAEAGGSWEPPRGAMLGCIEPPAACPTHTHIPPQ